MKFNNIERNILYLLGDKWLKSGSRGPFDTGWIFNRFSDIPDKNLKDAMNSIKDRGFVEFPLDYGHISLTQKGLSKIKVTQVSENNKIPVPKKLE